MSDQGRGKFSKYHETGRYRKAYPRLFRHPAFKALAPLAQRLTLYLLLGPQTNRIGLFFFSIATAAEDLGTTIDTLRKGLVEVRGAFGWTYDAAASVFFVPTFWRWNHPEGETVLAGNLKDLAEIPPCGLVDAFARNLEYLHPDLHQTFLEGIRIRLSVGTRAQKPFSIPTKQKKNHALRAAENDEERTNGTGANAIDGRIAKIAKDAIRDSPRNVDTDYLLDVILESCSRASISANRQIAIVALAQAQGQAATA